MTKNTNTTSGGNPTGTSGSKRKLAPESSGPSITKRARTTRQAAEAETGGLEGPPRYEMRTRSQQRASGGSSSNSPNTNAPTQGLPAGATAVAQGNPTGPGVQRGVNVDTTFDYLLDNPRVRNPQRRQAPGGVPFGATFKERRVKLRGWRVKDVFPCGDDLLPPPWRPSCCSLAGEVPAGRPRPSQGEPREPLGLDSLGSTQVGTRRTRRGPATGGSRHASKSSGTAVAGPSGSGTGDLALSAETRNPQKKRKRVRFEEGVDAEVQPLARKRQHKRG